jgi:predicted membrane protein
MQKAHQKSISKSILFIPVTALFSGLFSIFYFGHLTLISRLYLFILAAILFLTGLFTFFFLSKDRDWFKAIYLSIFCATIGGMGFLLIINYYASIYNYKEVYKIIDVKESRARRSIKYLVTYENLGLEEYQELRLFDDAPSIGDEVEYTFSEGILGFKVVTETTIRESRDW